MDDVVHSHLRVFGNWNKKFHICTPSLGTVSLRDQNCLNIDAGLLE